MRARIGWTWSLAERNAVIVPNASLLGTSAAHRVRLDTVDGALRRQRRVQRRNFPLDHGRSFRPLIRER